MLLGMTRDLPIPLRPDRNAVHRAAVNSIFRACVVAGKQALGDQGARSGDPDAQLILKAARSPLSLNDAPALLTVGVSFLASLTPLSAGAALLGRGISLTFGNEAAIALPTMGSGEADFVGEGKPIPVKRFDTSVPALLEPYKLAALATLTGEMLRSTNAEAMIRTALSEAAAAGLDKALFSNAAAVADERPPGLLNGITPLTAAGAGADAMVSDLSKLASAVAPLSGNGGIALIASPAQAVAMALRSTRELPWSVFTSASLAPGTVIAVATPTLVSAVSAPAVDASVQTLIHEETVPLPINATGVPATPVRSVFQTDATSIRLRQQISWALRDADGVAYMTGVNW
jgi:hypothetical protein